MNSKLNFDVSGTMKEETCGFMSPSKPENIENVDEADAKPKILAEDRFERKQMLVKPIFFEVNSHSFEVIEKPKRDAFLKRSLWRIG